MKIGILTYHRAENYGALLQAYATMTYLRSLGYDVSFVDYWPTYHSDYFRLFPWERFRRGGLRAKLGLLVRFLIWYIPRRVRKHKLQQFMHRRLGLPRNAAFTNSSGSTPWYDCVVYGSDQIWRKQHLGGVEFDPWYFGSANVHAVRKVTYAASMGSIQTTPADDAFVREAMARFWRISVRESDLQDYLRQLGTASVQVIDPVFLLSREQWLQVARPRKGTQRYIFFYNLLNTPESTRFADSLSRQTGLPVREVNKQLDFRHLDARYTSTASVEEFLGLLDGAEYVVSNSFHGVAFSLIFQKQFFAAGMRERANRVCSLLTLAGIPERYFGEATSAPATLPAIDYNPVSEKLSGAILHSQQFLKEALNP